MRGGQATAPRPREPRCITDRARREIAIVDPAPDPPAGRAFRDGASRHHGERDFHNAVSLPNLFEQAARRSRWTMALLAPVDLSCRVLSMAKIVVTSRHLPDASKGEALEHASHIVPQVLTHASPLPSVNRGPNGVQGITLRQATGETTTVGQVARRGSCSAIALAADLSTLPRQGPA